MAIARVSGSKLRTALVSLDRWRDALDNPKPALEKMMLDLEESADEGFSRGKRPLGNSWQALSPAYAAFKSVVRPGRPILTFDGELRDSLGRARGDGAIRVVTGTKLRYGTSVKHARYHQGGTPNMPSRPVLPGGSIKLQDLIAKAMQEHILKGG